MCPPALPILFAQQKCPEIITNLPIPTPPPIPIRPRDAEIVEVVHDLALAETLIEIRALDPTADMIVLVAEVIHLPDQAGTVETALQATAEVGVARHVDSTNPTEIWQENEIIVHARHCGSVVQMNIETDPPNPIVQDPLSLLSTSPSLCLNSTTNGVIASTVT